MGCETPEKVEIVFEGISVEAEMPFGRRELPSLPNAVINGAKVMVSNDACSWSSWIRKDDLLKSTGRKIRFFFEAKLRSLQATKLGKGSNLKTNYIIKCVKHLTIYAVSFLTNSNIPNYFSLPWLNKKPGEMLVGRARCFFMDDVSTGLDSSTTLEIMTFLRQMAHLMDLTMVISLLQPAPETFELFDDILLLCEGQIVYHGPRQNVIGFFNTIGFICPSRKNEADFLQEVSQ
ncbi:hypothetical protein HU200_064066 [Digitaria exilis]|uniref:ABC transporter family G domain-containing protein n=1 Tax=Digitaria exilis TaxID=1010633 RepID=A0A835DUT2_9POAL|nr:hypothetical protein HU200_064066 [Digitaria exilis]